MLTTPLAPPSGTLSTRCHRIGDSPDTLDHMRDPGVDLCLWRRPHHRAIADELSVLDARALPDKRHATSAESFDKDVVKIMTAQQLDPTRFEHLRADLHVLCDLFSRVSQGPITRFRLMTTAKNDCTRFHVDRMNLRLMCSYQGPGTEWLADDQVDRSAQISGARNAGMIRYGEPARFGRFWVGVIRGDPTNVGTGLVHRSPEIAGTGQIRVLFCLDS